MSVKRNSVFLLIVSFAMIYSCAEEKVAQSNIFKNGSQSYWIGDGIDLPKEDSLFYLDHPAPLFRKEFEVQKDIESASLVITAAGYYKVLINENGIENNVLDPAWTDFSKRIYYSEYDVTNILKEGSNCIGVALGNGFYNPLPLRKWGRRNLRKDLNVGKPAFISKLQIKYKDGSVADIVSDSTWKFTPGPLRKNSVYIGVLYDAREEKGRWAQAGYDDSMWKTASIASAPGGRLEKAFFPPVEITEEIEASNIYSPSNGVHIVDMGVNFTGTFKLRLSGNIGDTITFRFGERVYEDGSLNPMTTVIGQIKRKGVGGPGAPEIAWQTDSYIVGQEESNWFTPDFTYHTYRYIEIKGLSEIPRKKDVLGLMMHSNVPNENRFTSSSHLLNSIQEMTERTFLTNLVSVQSDCPAREKFAYGGDLNATSEAFIYNFDMQSFYRKTIYDWVDAMKDSSFVDTAPFVGIEYCGISWESAFLTTQYYLYLYYNDVEIVKELYDLDKKWMEKVAMIHPEGIVDEGLSDHESLEPVPVQLIGTSHYLHCARIMQEFAKLSKKEDDASNYERLAGQLQEQLRVAFWEKPYREKINRQTLFSTLLYYDVIPPSEIDAGIDSLLEAIAKGPSKHLNTGIFGTKYTLEALAKYGDRSDVYQIVNSREYPGWGFMIEQGATTIWETWKESENTFSNNHPMFGSVSEWFYRWLAGIKPDLKHPGFQEFFIEPVTPDGLDSVNCSYQSPHGLITSNWKKRAAGDYLFEIKIPDGSIANVAIAKSNSQTLQVKNINSGNRELEIEGLQSGQFSLSSGDYNIELLPR